MRKLVGIALATLAVIAACSNDYALDTPATPDGGAVPEAGAEQTTPDATIVDAASGEAGVATIDGGSNSDPAPIGTNCAAPRSPAPGFCEDFENGPPGHLLNESGGTTTIISPGSNSDHDLEVKTQAGSDESSGVYAYLLDNKYTHITWSFDLLVNTGLTPNTIVSAMRIDDIDVNGVNGCILQINRIGTGFTIGEMCELASGDDGGNLLTLHIDPPPSPVWWNVLVDVDFDQKNIRLAVRTDATSAPTEESAKIDEAGASDHEQLTFGVDTSSGTSPNSDVQVDNLVAYWK